MDVKLSDIAPWISIVVSVAGWIVTYNLSKNSALHLANKNRKRSRCDEIEKIVMGMLTIVASHLRVPGSDSGASERVQTLQQNSRHVLIIINDIFQGYGVPEEVSKFRGDLWEAMTGDFILDSKRTRCVGFNVEIGNMSRLGEKLIEAVRRNVEVLN